MNAFYAQRGTAEEDKHAIRWTRLGMSVSKRRGKDPISDLSSWVRQKRGWHCAARLLLPGNPIVRYGLRFSGRHSKNVGYNCYTSCSMAAVSIICAKGEKALFCCRELEEKEALSKSGSDWARNLTIAFAGPFGNVGGDLVLADYGLDSLGFPVLVARLEDTLGAATEDAIFPETPGDIVKVHEHGGR